MKIRNKNLKLLKQSHIYSEDMEHDACGVGLVASTEGKKTRKVVEYGIQALKAVWHRGAVDADGKTGDGAGIHSEIPSDFFIEKLRPQDTNTMTICLCRNDFYQEMIILPKCRTIVKATYWCFYILVLKQVPVDPKVLGEKAELTRPGTQYFLNQIRKFKY